MLNEIKAAKVLDGDGFRFASEARDPPATGDGRGSVGPVGLNTGDRRPRAAGDERFRVRRQRGRLPLHRRELRARSARAGTLRGHPQRGGGGPQPRRQGHPLPLPRHRSRPHLPARHQVLRGHERDFFGRQRRVEADGNGLLRHRRVAHRGRRHRAEPRRPRIIWPLPLAPVSHWPSRPSAGAKRSVKALADKLHDELRRRAWKCCSTIATSARA